MITRIVRYYIALDAVAISKNLIPHYSSIYLKLLKKYNFIGKRPEW